MNLKYQLFVIFIILFSCSPDETKRSPKEIVSSSLPEMVLLAGEYSISKRLIIRADQILKVSAGVKICFGKKGKIIVHGRIIAKGTSDAPIVFTVCGKIKKHELWRSIEIYNNVDIMFATQKKKLIDLKKMAGAFKHSFTENRGRINLFSHCIFQHSGIKKKNNFKAVIEATNALLLVEKSTFRKISKMGAIQLTNSAGIIAGNSFESCGIHKNIHLWNSQGYISKNQMESRMQSEKCNDGIWSIKSNSIITENIINGKGDDGIDLENSNAYVYSNKISGNKDDGIDIDLKSSAVVIKNVVENNLENGVIVSDGSYALLQENVLKNNNQNRILLRNGSEAYIKNNRFVSSGIKRYESQIDLSTIIKSHKENYERLARNLKGRKQGSSITSEVKDVESKLKTIRRFFYNKAENIILKNSLETPTCNRIYFFGPMPIDKSQLKSQRNLQVFASESSFSSADECSPQVKTDVSLFRKFNFEKEIIKSDNLMGEFLKTLRKQEGLYL